MRHSWQNFNWISQDACGIQMQWFNFNILDEQQVEYDTMRQNYLQVAFWPSLQKAGI